MAGPAYDAGSNVLALFEVVFMETAGYIIVGAICERISFWSFLLCELFIGAILYPVLRLLGVGWRAGCRSLATPWVLGMDMSISRDLQSCMRWVVSAPWRSP